MHLVTVRGRRREWLFETMVDPAHVQEWRDDGVEVFKVENKVPLWAAELGLMRLWCFVQDIVNFRNPWR